MIFYLATDERGFRQLRKTQDEARKINKDFTKIDIPTDATGLMAAIQELLTIADAAILNQGSPAAEPMPTLAPAPAPAPPKQQSYSERSVQIDELFMHLPLPHQLSLAAVALETARSHLKPQ